METLSSTRSQSWLAWFLRGFMLLGFAILTARIVDLQLIRGSYFRSLSEGNRIRRIPIEAPRGEILARGGEVLVGNKDIKKAVVYNKEKGYIKSTDTKDFKDDELITEPSRDYKLGKAVGHITGYVGEVNENEAGKIRGNCPEKGPRRPGSYVGRTGLEEQYECLLAGQEGEELVEVNSRGTKTRVFARRAVIPGQKLVTTIDFGLQKKVSEAMEGKKGAAVVTDANGQILAMYSSPSYDPNILLSGSNKEDVENILKNTDKPLFNRAIGGAFHPGSVYKPVSAMAALEEGKIDRNFVYEDKGQIVIETLYGTFSYRNWYFTQYGGTEGNIDLKRAIARSTDTFFYKIGELTGPDKLSEWSKKFKLDKKTEIDLPGEIEGLIPDPEWKMKQKKERWFLGNTYHMSIGQGDLAVTPLAMNMAIAAIANSGKYCRPHISNYLADGDGQDSCTEIGVEKRNIDFVVEGMKDACSAGGTAYTFFDFKEKSGIEVACKTGTAENEVGEPHAWFTAFDLKESNNPEIVLTILVENGGEGSKVAGPVAREIFDYWFKVPTPTPTNSTTLTETQTP